LPGFLIGIVQGTLILLIATLWFRVPLLGSLPAFYCGLALFLLSGVGAGLLISSLAVTQQQGLLGAFLFMVPAVILSGFATPIANMPQAVQILTYIDPLRYFLIILRKVFLEGAGFGVLARPVLAHGAHRRGEPGPGELAVQASDVLISRLEKARQGISASARLPRAIPP
jgi:ABC-type multidrug transport system permease subunit